MVEGREDIVRIADICGARAGVIWAVIDEIRAVVVALNDNTRKEVEAMDIRCSMG